MTGPKAEVLRNYIVFGRRSTAQLTFALGISLVVVFSLVPAVGILVISFDVVALADQHDGSDGMAVFAIGLHTGGVNKE